MANASPQVFKTPITEMFGIVHPVILAGMNVAAGPKLAAAVTNAGGLGVIGGVGYTPRMLRAQLRRLKADLVDKSAPFGVDLLLPQVGGGARKTNTDYTGGKLAELIDIVIESGARLFVSAVGVPPKWVVEKLHAANIPVMNMVGAPKHVPKALAAGVDLICAQGGEGGGHTGDVATSILIPACVDACRGKRSPLTGQPVHVIAAGGISDGRGLAMALCFGAQAVWVGTRFVAATEAGAPPRHKDAVVGADFHDTVRTIIFTGRPMRVLRNEYITNWETERAAEIRDLTSRGIVPVQKDIEMAEKAKDTVDPKAVATLRPLLMGQVAARITDVQPAKKIIDDMVADAAVALAGAQSLQVGGGGAAGAYRARL
eukprot:CAMPEP_0198333522 /NCGR_PEP_ID=MMETSP1450-20131203/18997_1 /TAXON_ID=753684 ORGANISM="Madagascaria erythrocladiodes, Strain CCMP3234" /NCGR_SAMPLE_ID=MMETSP1450 /ASSEMBLY_ACC=CAM_ASM_001115 /LENGTH=371 /DNA_ID=CAMNT_0044038047 /DNA_START=76 /DNA_END=1191 /DNA_ORIENTATION=+